MQNEYYLVPSSELQHYGVKGMKWGKRKASYYDEKARAHAAAIANSRTRLGKNYHNYRAYRNELKARDRNDINANRNNSVLRKADSFVGYGAMARQQAAASSYYNRKAQYTKTVLGTNMAKASAYNAKSASSAYSRLHDSKSLQEAGVNYVKASLGRSVKTWSGRTTTAGKQAVDAMLTGGTIGMVKDLKRRKQIKRAAKDEYKRATDKAFAEYEREIERIEKPYKRGQNLSAKDAAREEAIEKKYYQAEKKAKAKYRKALTN